MTVDPTFYYFFVSGLMCITCTTGLIVMSFNEYFKKYDEKNVHITNIYDSSREYSCVSIGYYNINNLNITCEILDTVSNCQCYFTDCNEMNLHEIHYTQKLFVDKNKCFTKKIIENNKNSSMCGIIMFSLLLTLFASSFFSLLKKTIFKNYTNTLNENTLIMNECNV